MVALLVFLLYNIKGCANSVTKNHISKDAWSGALGD